MSLQTQQALAFTGSTEDKKLLKLVSTEIPKPNSDQLLVKAVAFAANPTDFKHIVFGWGGKDAFVGSDVSGEVVAVGDKVNGFAVGDHVGLFEHGGDPDHPHRGLFKEYSVVNPSLTIRYPSKLKTLGADVTEYPASKVETFEGAAALSLSIFTVGQSFAHSFDLDSDKTKNAGKTVLIWGGSTATGILAIQVAKKAYGLKVVTTASKKHESFLKSLGADAVFDYHDSDVIDQIKKFSGESLVYGYDTVSDEGTWNSVNDALTESAPAIADNLLFLDKSVLKNPKKNVKYTKAIVHLASGEDQQLTDLVITGGQEFVAAHRKFYEKVVPLVLDGTIKHQPLRILHDGLGSAEEALSLLRNNKVSAEKLIFRVSKTE